VEDYFVENKHLKAPDEYAQLEDIAIVGKLIRIQREHIGMTQLDLAEKAMVGEKTISRLEQGKSNMRIETFFTLAAALCVTPNDISPPRYATIHKDVRFWDLESQYNLLEEESKQCIYEVMHMMLRFLLNKGR
jgi:transcriptional regulator with XRE-family HTH domain